MKLRRVILERLRRAGVAADVHAVVAVNTRGSQKTSASSRQRVVRRSGRN